MNPNISKSVLEQIETADIKPRSKGFYYLKYGSLWLLFAVMLGLGALSFAVILYALMHTDFAIFDYVEEGGWQQFLSLFPMLWFFALGLTVGLGVWGLRHTKRGYRLAVTMILVGNVLGSMVLGSLVYAAGGAEKIETTLEETLPQYDSVHRKQARFWGNPAKTGRLAGVVQSVDHESDRVTVAGPGGKTWDIPLSRLQKFGIEIQVGYPIKMRGTAEGSAGFLPEKIRRDKDGRVIHKRIRERMKKNPEVRERWKERAVPSE